MFEERSPSQGTPRISGNNLGGRFETEVLSFLIFCYCSFGLYKTASFEVLEWKFLPNCTHCLLFACFDFIFNSLSPPLSLLTTICYKHFKMPSIITQVDPEIDPEHGPGNESEGALGYDFIDEQTRKQLELMDELQLLGVSKYVDLPQVSFCLLFTKFLLTI